MSDKTFASLLNESNDPKSGDEFKDQKKESTGSFTLKKYDKDKAYFRKSCGPLLCCILFGSIFTIITGTILLLSGYYYVPDNDLPNKINSTQAISVSKEQQTSEEYNSRLKTLRIAGYVLLGCGCLGSVLLLLIPVICLGKQKYKENDYCDGFPVTTNIRSITAISPHQRGISLATEKSKYSIVKKHIQPRKTKQQQYRRLAKKDYDKGFLSPELNRGPIFVSDHASSVGSWTLSDEDAKRQRSKSDVQQLSPHQMFRIQTARYTASLSHESLTAAKRCDSFNSLQ